MVPRNPHRGRAIAGGVLYTLLMAAGATILLVLFVIQPLSGKNAEARLDAMELGALLAFPPLLVYLWVPWIIDRFDPEPWWCLALTLAWGGVAAAGFSGLINTEAVVAAQTMAGGGKNGIAFGEVVGACVSAPLVEEFWKGLAVFGIFFFLRREFDGVVDGIIYGTFAALGFAATENVMYYARAGLSEVLSHQQGALTTTFLLRGVLSPWGHPLYTSMTGIGFGIARETEKAWLRWLAPLLGYMFAVFLHGSVERGRHHLGHVDDADVAVVDPVRARVLRHHRVARGSQRSHHSREPHRRSSDRCALARRARLDSVPPSVACALRSATAVAWGGDSWRAERAWAFASGMRLAPSRARSKPSASVSSCRCAKSWRAFATRCSSAWGGCR